jgi:hypothetical protein
MALIGTLGRVIIILFGKPECVPDLYKEALAKLPLILNFRLIGSRKLKQRYNATMKVQDKSYKCAFSLLHDYYMRKESGLLKYVLIHYARSIITFDVNLKGEFLNIF